MNNLHALFAQLAPSDPSDGSNAIFLFYYTLWPLHTWSLFSYLGINTTVTKGLIQSGVLVAFATAVVLLIRRRGVKARYMFLVVSLGYPILVFVTNICLGL